MKKTGLIIISAICIITIFAQKTLNVFKTDLSVLNISIAAIDSMKFSTNSTVLDIHKLDKKLDNLPISSIDSITFTDSIAKTLPVVSSTAATTVSFSTAQVGITINSVGGTSISEKGICWSLTENPTIGNTKIISSALVANTTVNLSNLNAGSTIYVRPFATNASGTAYGEQQSFITLSCDLPVVETVSATYNNTTNKVNCVSKITSNGGCGIAVNRGVCWSTTNLPTINDSKYASGTGVGQFYSLMTNLSPNTTYYVRAYATNCAGTAYGNQLSIKLLMGSVTYTLDINPTTYPEPYRLIKIAMDSACVYYNRYTTFRGNIYVYYNTGIPTAQASYHGSIGFGSNTRYMWVGTAMHEMAHFMGSGTTTEWQGKVVNGIWTGPVASALLKSLTGETLKGDSQHFWPYGINQKEEITGLGNAAAQAVGLSTTAKLVQAMVVNDCGLPTSW